MLKKRIKATNIELTDAIREYAEKKVDAITKFVKDEIEALAEIEVGKTTNHHHKGDVFRAEVNLTIGDKQFRTVVVEDDLYKAIDKMKDGIVSEVKDANKKKHQLLKRGKQKIKDMIKRFRG